MKGMNNDDNDGTFLTRSIIKEKPILKKSSEFSLSCILHKIKVSMQKIIKKSSIIFIAFIIHYSLLWC